MRFEIRAGGGVLILFGLVGLSGAVFALGLVAGYEMARQSQPDMSQISSTYPLPNPPENPAPVSEMSPAAEASPAVAAAPVPRPVPIKPPEPAFGESHPAARTSPATVARVKPPPAPAVARPATEDEPTDEDSETDSAPAAPRRIFRRARSRTTSRSKP